MDQLQIQIGASFLKQFDLLERLIQELGFHQLPQLRGQRHQGCVHWLAGPVQPVQTK